MLYGMSVFIGFQSVSKAFQVQRRDMATPNQICVFGLNFMAD